VVSPDNTIVEVNGSFLLRCMPHDYWMNVRNYWFIYFSLTMNVCRMYETVEDEDYEIVDNCTHKRSRFMVYRRDYVLMLYVTNVTKDDAGLYVCANPPTAAYHTMGNLGLVAFVGVVSELYSVAQKTSRTLYIATLRILCGK